MNSGKNKTLVVIYNHNLPGMTDNLWESLGFVFFDQLEDPEKIAKANFYYGQLQIINEKRLISIN